ncbi:hypothetical protein FRC07_008179 [Ceratobasidium sp. 392]|nr:hypothetical protein FRC07_008179 [Ceratobasidium sp. 392]
MNVFFSAKRMTFEYEALQAVAQSSPFTPESTVQVPHVLFYDPETYTLIMNDLAPVRLLSSVLIEAFEVGTVESISLMVGAALGDFMGRFHKWGAQPEQDSLRKRFRENTSKEEEIRARYERMMATAEKYRMRKEWMQEMNDSMNDLQDGGSVIAKADFWINNILVVTEPELRLYIIDWEFVRCTRPEVDLADLAASAYSVAHLYPSSSSSFKLMHSFMQSYRKHFRTDDVRVALSAGRDMMGFGTDMPWTRVKDERIKEEIVKHGFELLEAAKRGSAEEIKKNPIVRDMYAYS